MNKGSKSALRAVLMGFAALLLFTVVVYGFKTFSPRNVNLTGYVLLAMVLTLSIMVAKFTNGRAWWHGLLAAIGMGVPGVVFLLHTSSPDPRTWVYFIGRPMLWEWVGLVSLVLTTSLWVQSAAFWFGRRRLFAALVAVASVGLVVAVFAAGFGLARFLDARAQAIQASAAQYQIDIPLPSLALAAMDGTPISASEFQGHITIVDFWATWCGACLAEFPSLEEVHKAYSGNSKVRFLLVDPEIEGDTPEKISSFLQRRPVSIPVALEPGASWFQLNDKLHTSMLPLLLVIDQRGHIRFRDNGFESGDKTARELQGEINTLLVAQ
jgi:thiol-disulfide isomerase/thioredoxin